MAILDKRTAHPGHGSGTSYTVIARSGQRGTEYVDPQQAAVAFFEACAEDRPFVLCNHASMSSVIAVTRAGRKALVPAGKSNGDFQSAYELLLSRTEVLRQHGEVGEATYTVSVQRSRRQRKSAGA